VLPDRHSRAKRHFYHGDVTNHKPNRATLIAGFTLLILQALTTPFVVGGALRTPPAQPAWVSGLFLALDFGSIASLGILAWGLRTGRSVTRFAPLFLVLPAWLAVAALSPLQQSGGSALVYSLFSLAMGAGGTVPFLLVDAQRAFDRSSAGGDSGTTGSALSH
jgi:hypothetical protein